MLAVPEARHRLGAACPMTDDEIEAMLRQFRLFAFIALDIFEAEQRRFNATMRENDS